MWQSLTGRGEIAGKKIFRKTASVFCISFVIFINMRNICSKLLYNGYAGQWEMKEQDKGKLMKHIGKAFIR